MKWLFKMQEEKFSEEHKQTRKKKKKKSVNMINLSDI